MWMDLFLVITRWSVISVSGTVPLIQTSHLSESPKAKVSSRPASHRGSSTSSGKVLRESENPSSFNQIQPVYDGSFSTLQWKSLHPLVLLRVQPGNFPPSAPCRHLPRTLETCFSAKIHYKSYPHKCNANIWDSTYITTKQKTLVWSVNFMTSCIHFDTSETYITCCVWCLHRSETTTLQSMLEQSRDVLGHCQWLSSPKKRRQIEQIELGQDQRWNISKFQVWIQHASTGNDFVW